MKKIYSCSKTLLSLSFLFTFAACTTDTSFVSSDVPESVVAKQEIDFYNFNKSKVIPANIENPYDSDGQMYHELLKNYYTSDGLHDRNSIGVSYVDSIAYTESLFQKKDNNSDIAVSDVTIISHSSTLFSDVINNSNMTADAKLSLIDFIHSFLFFSKQEDRYSLLYDFVVTYENHILNNPILTNTDRQVILTTTSFARYSTYEISTESTAIIDPDWRILIGHLIGGVEVTE